MEATQFVCLFLAFKFQQKRADLDQSRHSGLVSFNPSLPNLTLPRAHLLPAHPPLNARNPNPATQNSAVAV